MNAQQKLQVLIVDDDKLVQKIVLRTLKDVYDTIVASNGEEGLTQAQSNHPDVILLDVEMEGMNGYIVCEQLKQNESTKDIPVIFISGNSSIRQRMLGYEAGGIDYIVKPFEQEELLAKLSVITNAQETSSRLKDEADVASATAIQAMQGSSELGRLMSFVDSTYRMTEYNDLAMRLINAMKSFQLNCCVYIKTKAHDLFFCEVGEVKPLEQELLVLLSQSDERFHDFGCRTQVNYPNISMLVKNMPLEDRSTYGRYKDMLPHIVSAVDTQVKNLITYKAMVSQTEYLAVSFKMVNETLAGLTTRLQDNENKCLGVMRLMMDDLDKRVPGMGLEDDQETYLLDLIDESMTQVIEVMDDSCTIRQAYDSVMRHLSLIGDQQQNMAEEIGALHGEKEGGSDTDVDMDVELF
ncbi:MAG: response regulator [Pseudomonadales bacterium]|nr:response regulator [Pseudomonadales bacterium]